MEWERQQDATVRPWQLSYETVERKQKWSIADEFYEEDDTSVLCLPGGVRAFIKFGQQEGDAPLTVGISWTVEDNLQFELAREYDEDGALDNVQHSTAVRGGWIGGRM